jgi:hypothetical protein
MQGLREDSGRLFLLEAPKSFDFANLSLYYECLRSMDSIFNHVPAPIKKMPYVFNQEKGFAI